MKLVIPTRQLHTLLYHKLVPELEMYLENSYMLIQSPSPKYTSNEEQLQRMKAFQVRKLSEYSTIISQLDLPALVLTEVADWTETTTLISMVDANLRVISLGEYLERVL